MGCFASKGNQANETNMIKGKGAQHEEKAGVVYINTDKEFKDHLKKAGSKLMVVDFFTTWCGPCKIFGPELVTLAKDNNDVLFFKVDCDRNKDSSGWANISAYPTIKFYKNGDEVGLVKGADVKSVKAMIQKHKKQMDSLPFQ